MIHGMNCNHSYPKKANHSFNLSCNDAYMERLSERIKRLRDSRKLTQQQVADAIGVTRVSVTKWENGQTANLKLDNLTELCVFFGVTYDEMILGGKAKYNSNLLTNSLTAEEPETGYVEKSKNVEHLHEHRHKDKKVCAIADIYDALSDKGQVELIDYAKYLVTKFPRQKANPAS